MKDNNFEFCHLNYELSCSPVRQNFKKMNKTQELRKNPFGKEFL